jgi:hypothetical protein
MEKPRNEKGELARGIGSWALGQLVIIPLSRADSAGGVTTYEMLQ